MEAMDVKHVLVSFLNANIDELTLLLRHRYRQEYPHSSPHELSEDSVLAWIRVLLKGIIRGIETDAPAMRLDQMRTGDMVIHSQEIVGPLFTLTENYLFFGKTLAMFVMQRHIDDPELADAMIECLETCIRRTVGNAHVEFAERVQTPGYLAGEWRRASVQGFSAMGYPDDGGESRPAGVQLTQREQQIMDLVLRGRSNAQIASELGLQLSTVKNNVSRILSKHGVASRTELTVKLLGEKG